MAMLTRKNPKEPPLSDSDELAALLRIEEGLTSAGPMPSGGYVYAAWCLSDSFSVLDLHIV